MRRRFISISKDGEVLRHEEVPQNVAAIGHTVIEIAPESALANVRVFVLDEEGERMEEVS